MSTLEITPQVSSHGYGDASIFFLGGHALKEDALNGIALSGHLESTLNQFLHPNKLSLKNCYRSLFIKEKLEYSGSNPKKLRNAMEKVNTKAYEELLFNEINDVKPNIIVPLDDIALSIVFPHINTIRKPKGRKYWVYCYRGSILPLREDWQNKIGLEYPIKIIPTLGPQLLYNDWTARSYVGLDFKKIKEVSLARSAINEFGFTWVAKNAADLQRFFERAFNASPKRLSFDVETYGGMLTCISFCFDAYEAVTVPLMDKNISLGELCLMWRLVGKVLASGIEKNNQNIKYDWIILERHGFKVNNVRSDTMLKGALLYPELPKGLDFYTSLYTPIPYYKDEGKEFNPKLHSRDRLYIYCAKDSLAAQIIANKQDLELDEMGLRELYEREISPSILIYKNIDETGILVDSDQKNKLNNKYESLYENNLAILRNLVGNSEFNPKSPLQVGKLLYEELKFPIRKKTLEDGTSSYKTDKETLDDLLIHHGENNKAGRVGYEIISRTIVCRKLSKAIEYINTPLHPDNTFRGSSNLAGTETGRSSFSKTIDEVLLSEPRNNKWTRRLGRSLQTISKHGFHIDEDIFDDFESSEIANDLRSMFVPHRDYVFIECDGKAAEARVVAILAEDLEMLAAMDTKPSIHAKTIGNILGIDPNTINKTAPTVPKLGMPYYELGKRIRHAGHNGMRAGRLSQYTHLSLAECENLMEKFHAQNPKIRLNLHKGIMDFVREKRFLVCPNGRRRDFFARLDDKLYHEAFCYIQQAVVSDLTKFTMHRVASFLPGYMTNYKFLTEQHDGFLAEVHKDLTEQYIHASKVCYERPIDFNLCSLSRNIKLTIPVETSISVTNWQELKEMQL